MPKLLLEQGYLLNDLESKIYLANNNKIPCSTAFPRDPIPATAVGFDSGPGSYSLD